MEEYKTETVDTDVKPETTSDTDHSEQHSHHSDTHQHKDNVPESTIETESNQKQKKNILLSAVREFDKEKVKQLLDSGHDIQEKDELGYNACHILIISYVSLDIEEQLKLKSKSIDILELLIKTGFDINSTCNKKNTPLHMIAFYDEYPHIIKALQAAGAKTNVLDKKGRAAIHVATRRKNYDTLKTLIDGGADVNIHNKEGLTPLHIAAHAKHNLGLMQLLIKCGANVNAKDVAGRTPLHIAAKWGREELINELLYENVDVNYVDNAGLSPLHYSVKGDLTGRGTLLLLNHQVDLNIQDIVNEETALHKAIRLSMVDNIKQLLKFRPGLNIQDIQGETALHAASQCYDIIVWQLLLRKGGDLYVVNRQGLTPLKKVMKAKNHVALGVIKVYDESFT